MNRETIKEVIAFIGGTAIGSAITWFLVKRYYEELTQEEIDEFKEETGDPFRKYETLKTVDENEADVLKLKDESNVLKSANEKAAFNADKPEINEFADYVKNDGTINYSAYSKDTEENNEEVKENEEIENKGEKTMNLPYVIPPDKFGEFDDYDTVELTYYSDKTLADENLEIVEDIDGAIGKGALTHFGEYEDDSVFVRNDLRKCDYQILLDEGTYEEAMKQKPYLAN